MGFRYDIIVFQEGLKHELLCSLMDKLRLARLYKQFFQACIILEVADEENLLRHLSVKSVYFFMVTLSGVT